MAKHPKHCKNCKATVASLLKAIYGGVWGQHSLRLPAQLNGYEGYPCFEALSLIHQGLQNHRGHRSFARANKLPPVDYYLPGPGFVVEFDKPQHFTEPRLISLSCYPSELQLGYDRDRWMELSRCLDRHDNDPEYRDEQRAWYDTLRHFLPVTMGGSPTARLYAGDRQWCSLDPGKAKDVDLFYCHLNQAQRQG